MIGKCIYIVKRKAYQRKFDDERYDNLEGLMRNPKIWWKAVKLRIVGTYKCGQGANAVNKVIDR